VAAACTTALCVWQLGRLQGRRAANAAILARMNQPALRLDGGPLDPDAANLRRAVVRGTFDYSQEIVLRNRTYGEVPGVHLLVPLRIAGAEAAVLVDRGWIPFELALGDGRAAFRDAVGEVAVYGVLRQSQARRSRFSPADPPIGPDRPRLDAWFRVDLPRIQQQTPYPLLGLFLEEETPPGAQPRWLPRPDPDIRLDEGSHLLYAIQWAAFTGILLLGYGYLFHTRTRAAPVVPAEPPL
jgi:surfeit locus 1 family protein